MPTPTNATDTDTDTDTFTTYLATGASAADWRALARRLINEAEGLGWDAGEPLIRIAERCLARASMVDSTGVAWGYQEMV